MSKYIEELTMHVADSQVLKYAVGYEKEAEVVNKDSIEAALDMLDSLGENARRQLEIGIEMDNQSKGIIRCQRLNSNHLTH